MVFTVFYEPQETNESKDSDEHNYKKILKI